MADVSIFKSISPCANIETDPAKHALAVQRAMPELPSKKCAAKTAADAHAGIAMLLRAGNGMPPVKRNISSMRIKRFDHSMGQISGPN